MTSFARELEKLGFCLRSGGADGADIAFENGVTYNKQIFLPWNGFNGRQENGMTYIIPEENLEYVKKYHPAAHRLKPGALKLMSRNTNQVLGPDFKTPSEFVLCWTKDGKSSGGTGQALRIAKDHNIPIFNLFNKNTLSEFKTYMRFNYGN